MGGENWVPAKAPGEGGNDVQKKQASTSVATCRQPEYRHSRAGGNPSSTSSQQHLQDQLCAHSRVIWRTYDGGAVPSSSKVTISYESGCASSARSRSLLSACPDLWAV